MIVVFVLLSIAPIARVVRASTLVWSEREFVLAAKTMGARNGRIMFREVLPNVAPALISYSLIIMAEPHRGRRGGRLPRTVRSSAYADLG